MRGLMIGEEQRRAIGALRNVASASPVDVQLLLEQMKDPDAKSRHMGKMKAQTIDLPFGFNVTYSVEIGHPAGVCRHLSVAIDRADRLPHPDAVWMIAEEFGFSGGFAACSVWKEDFQHRGLAINVVQPLPEAS